MRPSDRRLTIARNIWPSLFLLSAGTLAFETNLTRIFSVAQFYHFAFMIVSIALLGFGASGTALAVFAVLRRGEPERRLSAFACGAGLGMLAAFALINYLPFDSFSIAWDRRQILILIIQYIALAAPFFFSGLAVGYLLDTRPRSAGTVYAVNLFGSSVGCLLALVGPSVLGGEGMVVLSAALAVLAALIPALSAHGFRRPLVAAIGALLLFCLLDLGLRLTGRQSFSVLQLRTSPYKSLSYALQYPGARVIYRAWNAFSRIDVVHSGGIHSVPGISYRFLEPLPALDGLLVDGDDLSPILDPEADVSFVAYLPNAVAFHLRPQAHTLILEPRGGLDVSTALALSRGPVTAVEVNPLIVDAARVYRDPRVEVRVESDRNYLRRTASRYDVIVVSLASSFHPVRSGAYTLAEDYRYTVESFQDALTRLTPGGLLVATRWLQDPPSEDLRLFALAITALEKSGGNAHDEVLAFRGFNTATVVLRNGAFTPQELASVRRFLAERAFDLTYAPDVRPNETNQYNILPQSEYYQAYRSLLDALPRDKFYSDYEYDVRPPTDDHPFYSHYFKWEQAPQVIAEFGKAWQPFGGAGYFVIVALLILAILLASLLILLPIAALWHAERNPAIQFRLHTLLYFGLLGFAFLFVEIPLLQRFILYLDEPAYAITTVLFSLLFFSGLGSRYNDRMPLWLSLPILVVVLIGIPLLLPWFFARSLGLPLPARLGLTSLVLSPLGFLMGIPFPAGITLLSGMPAHRQGDTTPDGEIPWIWAVNGAASVVASVLAALLVLSFGVSTTFRLGALCYAGAWLTVLGSTRWSAAGRPPLSGAQS